MTTSAALRRTLLAATLLLAACRSGGGGGDARTYNKEGVDWSKYTVVYLEEANVTTSAARNEKVDATLADIKGLTETSLRAAFENSRRFETVTVKPGDKVAGKTLVCRCKVDVNFGSTALRVMVGFGAGRSGLAMTPELHDGDTGDLLLSYQGWGGAIGGWGGQVVEKMRVDVTRVANYFASLVPRPAAVAAPAPGGPSS